MAIAMKPYFTVIWLTACCLASRLQASPAPDEWNSQLSLYAPHYYAWLSSDATRLSMIVGIGTILVFDVHSGRAVYDDTYGVPCGTHLSDSRSYDPCASRGITHSRSGDTLAYIKPHQSNLGQALSLVLLDIRQPNAFLQINLAAVNPLLLNGYSVHSIWWQYGRSVTAVFDRLDSATSDLPQQVLIKYYPSTGRTSTISGENVQLLDEEGDEWFIRHADLDSANHRRPWFVHERQFPYVVCTNLDSTKVFDEITFELLWQTAGGAVGSVDGFVHTCPTDTAFVRHSVSSGNILAVLNPRDNLGFKDVTFAPARSITLGSPYLESGSKVCFSGRIVVSSNHKSVFNLADNAIQSIPHSAYQVHSINTNGHIVFSETSILDSLLFARLDMSYHTFRYRSFLGRIRSVAEFPGSQAVVLASESPTGRMDYPRVGQAFRLGSNPDDQITLWEPYHKNFPILSTQPINCRIDGVFSFLGGSEPHLQISVSREPSFVQQRFVPYFFSSTDTAGIFSLLSSKASTGNSISTVLSYDKLRVFSYDKSFGSIDERTLVHTVGSLAQPCSTAAVGNIRAIPGTSNAVVGERYLVDAQTCTIDSLHLGYTTTLATAHPLAMAYLNDTTLILDLRHTSFRQTQKLYTPKSASQSFASNDRLLINVDSSGVVSVFDQGGTVTRTHTLTGWQPTWNMLAWTTNTGLLTQVSKANGYIRTWNTNGTLLRELRYPTQLLANTFVTNISARVIIAPYFNGALYWSEGFDPHILSINDNILFDSNTPGPEEHHNSNAVVEFFTLLGQRINPIDTSIHRTLLEVRRTPHRVTSTLVCHSW